MNKQDKLLVDLFKAYFSARRNKRNTINALKFEMAYEHNLIELWEEIVDRRYQPRPSICFIVNKPVKREVFAADFRDRIVHHLIFNYISPVFEKRFIYDSYSCRKKKGTHFGISRVIHFIRSCSKNYRNNCYVMKLDIRGYFMSIDRSLLFEMIMKRVKMKSQQIDGDIADIVYLIRQTIFNNPVDGCIFRSPKKEWNGLPPTKSLFHAPVNKGLPIGNLTSQLFGNVYLDGFDHYMKAECNLRYYGRYVDDMVIVHHDQYQLQRVRQDAARYLKDQLCLEVHPDKFYLQNHSKGLKFLGVMIKPFRIYCSRRMKGNFFQAMQEHNKIARDHKPCMEEREKFVAVMNSYLGTMKHYKTFKFRKRTIKRHLSAWWWNRVAMKGGFAKFVCGDK